jgi:hypothetical protein
MATFRSGKSGYVTSAGITLPVTGWTVNDTSEKIDVTNAAGNGFAEFISGIYQGDVSFTAIVDFDRLPNSTPGLIKGATVAVRLYLGLGGTGPYYGGNLIVESCNYSSAVRGQPVQAAISGSFTGTYTEPS